MTEGAANPDMDRLVELYEIDTERDRVRKQLLSLLAAAVDLSPDALVITYGNGEIVFFNDRAEHIFDYHRSEVIGKQVEMLLPEGIRDRHVAHGRYYNETDFTPFARTMGQGLLLLGRQKDGSLIPLDITLAQMIVPTGRYNMALARRSQPKVESGNE